LNKAQLLKKIDTDLKMYQEFLRKQKEKNSSNNNMNKKAK